MSLLPSALRPNRSQGGRILAALDIGSYKISCLIGMIEPTYSASGEVGQRFRPLGLGHQRSAGVSAGAVVDLRRAQMAVAAALTQAEQAAGTPPTEVVLSVTCGNPSSQTFTGHVDITDGIVTDSDIARLDSGACGFATRDGSALLSLNRIAYALDQVTDVIEPRGLAGLRLYANHHAVTADTGALRNLRLLAESCQIEEPHLVPAAYASAIAVTSETERQTGVTCIDIGAGTTSIAGFLEGHFLFNASVPVGGQQVTQELAHGLAVSLAEAERIKTLYANLILTASDEHEMVPLTREMSGTHAMPAVSRAEIGRMVAASMARVLWRVRAYLDGCSIARLKAANVVVTGGASELLGLEEFAVQQLGRPVRIAAAPRLDGAAGRLRGSVSSPAFSCVTGLALAARSPSPWIEAPERSTVPRDGYFARIERWLRESF